MSGPVIDTLYAAATQHVPRARPASHARPGTRAQTARHVSARPFLKWAGGKTQLLAELLQRFPKHFNRYHEPFVGGGAVFFALAPRRAVLSDINGDLIGAYAAVRDDVESVIGHLHRHRACAEHFYRVRAQKPQTLHVAARAARVIYLNRTCFNGLYRVNQAGQFNVPFGKHPNPTICNRANLRAAAGLLRSAVLRQQSVWDIGRQVRRGDLVYFDPPYHPLSHTANFTAYSVAPFGTAQQRELARLFARLAARGVHVVLSNSDTPLVRQLYRGFRIERVMATRRISCRADGRTPVAEVIVTAPSHTAPNTTSPPVPIWPANRGTAVGPQRRA